MVPQPQIHFAKLNLKNLRGPMSILNITHPAEFEGRHDQTARENQVRFRSECWGIHSENKECTEPQPFYFRPHFWLPGWTLVRTLLGCVELHRPFQPGNR